MTRQFGADRTLRLRTLTIETHMDPDGRPHKLLQAPPMP